MTPPIADLCTEKVALQPPWIVTLEVRRKTDSPDWYIPCDRPVALSEFLATTLHHDWLLKVESRDTWALDKLIATVAAFDAKKHFAVQTGSQKVAMYLRKNAPQWLYAADSASLLRLQMYESLWIETAMEFWPDFVIWSPQQKQVSLGARSFTEMQRRNKRIVRVWGDDADQVQDSASINGIMTGRPSAALKKFGERL